MPVNQPRADVYTHRSAGAVAACMLLSKRACIISRLCYGFKSHPRTGVAQPVEQSTNAGSNPALF